MNIILQEILPRIDCGEIASAQIYHLLDIYYQSVVYLYDKRDTKEDETEEIPFPSELKLELEDRKSGIGEALRTLAEKGCDVNEYDGDFNALMIAVGAADAPMVRYLIERGGDVNKWPGMDDPEPVSGQNYYLEDIDIGYMNECYATNPDKDYLDALYNTAMVLIREGGLRSFSGYSLKVDENGHGSLGPADVLF